MIFGILEQEKEMFIEAIKECTISSINDLEKSINNNFKYSIGNLKFKVDIADLDMEKKKALIKYPANICYSGYKKDSKDRKIGDFAESLEFDLVVSFDVLSDKVFSSSLKKANIANVTFDFVIHEDTFKSTEDYDKMEPEKMETIIGKNLDEFNLY